MNVVQIDTWSPEEGATIVPRPMRSGWRGELVDAAITAVPVVLIGAPVGLLWAAIRPSFDPILAVLQSSRYSAAFSVDLRFALITALAGLLVGVIAWWLSKRNSLGVSLGLMAGGIAAAWIAQRTGVLATHPDHLRATLDVGLRQHLGLRFSDLDKDVQAEVLEDSRFGLRATPLLLVLPTMAAATYATLTGLRDRSSMNDVSGAGG